MPRTPNNISQDKKNELRGKLLSVISFPVVTNYDCLKLSQEIEEQTSKRLSPSTIRRFFDIEKSQFNTSVYTIEVFEEFVRGKWGLGRNEMELRRFILEVFSPSHHEELSALDTSMHAVYRKVAMILRTNESLLLAVMDELARSNSGRVFYYELFPDYEILSKFQFKGYERYLAYSKSENDVVFALSLLIKSAGLRNATIELENYLKRLRELKLSPEQMHPFVLGRYMSTLLRFANTESEKRRVLKKIEDQIQYTQPDKSIVFGQFPGFHYFLSDALIDVGETRLLNDVLMDAKRYPRLSEFEWKGYYDQFELFTAWYYFLAGHYGRAESILATIVNSDFYFISREYFSQKMERLRILLMKARNNQ